MTDVRGFAYNMYFQEACHWGSVYNTSFGIDHRKFFFNSGQLCQKDCHTVNLSESDIASKKWFVMMPTNMTFLRALIKAGEGISITRKDGSFDWAIAVTRGKMFYRLRGLEYRRDTWMPGLPPLTLMDLQANDWDTHGEVDEILKFLPE